MTTPLPHNPHLKGERTPFDGLPYYCALCGKAYEGRHCEELNCELESAVAARARQLQNSVEEQL
jgi:hypothetical protein